MAKSALEKQLERQMKQQKDLARKQEQEARKVAIRQRASSIVNGQQVIDGFRIIDITAEEVLACLLKCDLGPDNHINFSYDIFPGYVQDSISLELEKLTQYGMIAGLNLWMGGGILYIQPPAFTYFQNKDLALKRQKERDAAGFSGTIINYGNFVAGEVSGSTLTVDNSIHEIERQINTMGGEDKDELKELLEEIKELIENIEVSHTIPKQKKLFERITNHASKHGWFYGAIIQLLGTATMGVLGGSLPLS